MARSQNISAENNFIKGLVSEATGLNFPENAATDTYDCIFDAAGFVTRRFGIDYEASATTSTTTTRSSSAISEFLWEAAAGNGQINFTVLQIGSTLHFYKLGSTTNVSGNKKSYTVNIDTYKTSGAPVTNTEPCQFTSGFGTLFVTHPYCEPFNVTYDSVADTISTAAITVQIRDFKGVNDGYSTDQRPSDYSTGKTTRKHLYNLMNQGWYLKSNVLQANFSTNGTPIGLWNATQNDWPSNADVWWQFKDANEKYNALYLDAFAVGSSPAPKGHYIYTAWNIDRASTYTSSGLTGNGDGTTPLPDVLTSSYFRPATCSFYAGRVWYAGVNAPDYSTNIYFTKIIESSADYGYCMQVNDPTSETNSDLLATDGGVITIPEIGNIVRMVPVGSDLVIFATNGIWVVSGSRGLSFTATDYAVRKLSSIPALGPFSIINVDGYPMFWNTDGIYVLTPSQTTGDLGVQSATNNTIATWYEGIPATAKLYAKASYNSFTKVVSWLYRTTAPSTVDQRYEFDRILNFSTLTGAFYPWTIQQASGYPVVTGIVTLMNYGAFTPTTKFLAMRNTTGSTWLFTWAESYKTTYKDWESYSTGLDYTSYIVSGYKVHGQGVANFQKNYILVYCQQQSNSSLQLRGRWMYANNANTGLWTANQEVYNSTVANRDYVVRRIKIRGQGQVCQLEFRSSTGKPFVLAGWAAFETANASV